MPPAKWGGSVHKKAQELLAELNIRNQEDITILGRYLRDEQIDKAMALLLVIGERNGMASIAAALLQNEEFINDAEQLLSTHIRRLTEKS